jgi:hypothetical protein
MLNKKIALLLVVAIVLALSLSVVGSIQAHAVTWNGDLQVSNNGSVTSVANNTDETFGKIMDKYKGVITFVGGIATVTMVAIFILNFMKLGSTSTNPTERQKVLTGLVWSGVAAALLGSVTLIVGVFYGMLK